ncbi:hypothetical protein BPNPMPFG_002173 [Mesorhizobium sp. AR07]|uniref:hypothetical protein n=1 Tax=Mesorhizobium sp. AR07 TaxID=2865838 RepID=UPI0021606D6F|nr:hypothetical protein [Mesorhizobium sp. AR07]UVK46513.1 hypothetical protein BPNPMPFG_002173 [Mesorhizobium sp. AR07]
MSADMSDCPARTWLAMMFLSVAGFLALLVLLLAIAALGKYLLSGRRTTISGVDRRPDSKERQS